MFAGRVWPVESEAIPRVTRLPLLPCLHLATLPRPLDVTLVTPCPARLDFTSSASISTSSYLMTSLVSPMSLAIFATRTTRNIHLQLFNLSNTPLPDQTFQSPAPVFSVAFASFSSSSRFTFPRSVAPLIFIKPSSARILSSGVIRVETLSSGNSGRCASAQGDLRPDESLCTFGPPCRVPHCTALYSRANLH